MSWSELPPLDCHAHIAPDVTGAQLRALEGAQIFAMTRSPAEAAAARRRIDPTLTWGFGAHPGLPDALATLTQDAVRIAVEQHVLIGEVGLDRRGPLHPQIEALQLILEICRDKPVLLSLHSTGRTRQILDLLAVQPQSGAILHWFNGTPAEIAQAVELGCYFSVNNAMSDEKLAAIPRHRILPETDFPASRRTTLASRPGDTRALERRLADRDQTTTTVIRAAMYRNLGRIAAAAGAEHRLTSALSEAIAAASPA